MLAFMSRPVPIAARPGSSRARRPARTTPAVHPAAPTAAAAARTVERRGARRRIRATTPGAASGSATPRGARSPGGAEPRGELLRAAREDPHVGADGGERAPELDVATGERLVGGEDPGRLPAGVDARDRVLDRALHVGVLDVADVAERGG